LFSQQQIQCNSEYLYFSEKSEKSEN